MNSPTTTSIFIPAKTIVFRLENVKIDGANTVKNVPVELLGDVYVDATRHLDGGWGYTTGTGRKTQAYCCAASSASLDSRSTLSAALDYAGPCTVDRAIDMLTEGGIDEVEAAVIASRRHFEGCTVADIVAGYVPTSR